MHASPNRKMNSEPLPERRRKVRSTTADQKAAIVHAALDLFRQELEPLRRAVKAILENLGMSFDFDLAPRVRRRRSKPKEYTRQKRREKQMEKSSDSSEDELDLGSLDSFDMRLPEAPREEDFRLPQPRGNNSTFHLQPLPVTPPISIDCQHREEWEKLYGQVRRLLEGKRAKGERGWFDFEKKMLLQLVTKAGHWGADLNALVLLLGLSHSTLKRWRDYFR